ncbi:SRPBCC domain-containing protein [Caulobacter sp. 17J80-11]|uniref:SRPBCC family protein n=1 Tax=Caulobacter sp. 17J80-11 TaxID=2763502 RepID=UPI001653BD53|nr:SRPBCC domain-containing protein [Caulobacter sp. 17J80-11]MBC6981523.1 SRPBCC domain-containing protein [Caulobacter sp. 17J80-11]
MRAWILAAALAAAAGTARAEVVDAQAGGFQVRETVEVAAKPDAVWKALVDVGGWWSSDHTWSGDAKNLSIDPKPGGCWCERWKDGAAQHMTVTFVQPNRELRTAGALGPLSMMAVSGAMTFKLQPKGEGTVLTATYSVGGYAPQGLAGLAAPVDGVLKTQVERLGRYAVTGKL